MNAWNDFQSDASEPAMLAEQIDRLVDGELPRDEYRRLLSELDERPGGWKRCALGFLEAQAWRNEFDSDPPAGHRDGLTRAQTKKPAPTWTAPAAVAASFLMALGLGLMLGRQWTVPAVPGASDVVDRAPTPESTRPVEQVRPPALAEHPNTETMPQPALGPSPVGDVRFVVQDADGAASREIQLPVYEANSTDGPWLGANASAMPAELQRALERRGHRIRRHQRWVPVDLDDGRQMVVPIEDVEIVPVGRNGFQ